MKHLYQIAQISKQAHHKHRQVKRSERDLSSFYLGLVEQARLLHPVIGLEKVYYLYKPQGIGRDAFITLASLAGYALEKRIKTSWKSPISHQYDNLLTTKELTGVNQCWVTDITYYRIRENYYYISMMMDLYSRKILSYAVACSLEAKHSLKVLKNAIKHRKLPDAHQLIHHSDRGVQYTCSTYVRLLEKHHIRISMCHSVYENTQMERLNGIIKNDYLVHWQPRTYNQLVRLTKQAVQNYNQCPHHALNMMSPVDFEQHLLNVPLNQRTSMKVFTFKKCKSNDPNQLNLFESSTHFVNQKGQPISG